MGRYGGYWLGLVLLLFVGGASTWAALSGWRTVTRYSAPYRAEPLIAHAPPLSERVLLIVLDGIRVDTATQMPALQSLASRGASGTLRTVWPSLSNPARATLVTGAYPEVHGVTANSPYDPPPVASLFGAARGAPMPFAAAGSPFWARAFADGDEDQFRSHEKEPETADTMTLAEWQDDTCSADLRFLGLVRKGFLIAGITVADSAGHEYGGESPEFLDAARAVDACIDRFVQAFDDGSTTLVVTSDHGHVTGNGMGGHGGWEDNVRNVPVVFAGAGIAPERGWTAEQTSIAPTIAALLGLPLPALAQGPVLWDVLDAEPAWFETARPQAAAQQAIVTDTLPDWETGPAAQRSRRLPKALAFAFGALVFAAMAFVRMREEWAAVVLAALVYCGGYYGICWLAGIRYSLSSIGREEYLASFFATDFGAAAAAYALAFALLRLNRGEPLPKWSLDLGAICTAVAVLNVSFCEWFSGLRMGTFLPMPYWAIRGYLELVAIAGIASAAAITFTIEALLARAERETEKLRALQLEDEEPEPATGTPSR